MAKPKIDIYLANPRGFCAGVKRAVEIVELALQKYGKPVYVRHEIVHNKFVVEQLRHKGAIFVDETKDIPVGAIAIFSAHGVSKTVENEAGERKLQVIDATCPLVKKVHLQTQKFAKENYKLILIGHKKHPEAIGTSGRVQQEIFIVENEQDVAKIPYNKTEEIAYVTQTTLSVDETSAIISKLKEKYPNIIGPDVNDICYATQNRQDAVKKMVSLVDKMLVIGAANSSNSNRLHDIALKHKIDSHLVATPSDVFPEMLSSVNKLGITAGASAPDELVQQIITRIGKFCEVQLQELPGLVEKVRFKAPNSLLT
jgi:4-hydroxy-3-methylbut-2-enyl diphosphate reductase